MNKEELRQELEKYETWKMEHPTAWLPTSKERVDQYLNALEPKQPELIKGQWYRRLDIKNTYLVWMGGEDTYGFWRDEFRDKLAWQSEYQPVELMNNDEVFEILKAEAIKRGIWDCPIVGLVSEVYDGNKSFSPMFGSISGVLWSEYGGVFQDGTWATKYVPTPPNSIELKGISEVFQDFTNELKKRGL